MLVFRSIRVVSFSLEYFDVYWEIEPTTEDLQRWDFYVERSEGEAGPWTRVAGPLIDRYYVQDSSVPQINTNRRLFYRVVAIRREDERTVTSDTTDRIGDPDLVAAEVIRTEQVYFREYAGSLCWLFGRRTFGQRCPSCFDAVIGKSVSKACKVCWGTGFAGGYHHPISFHGLIERGNATDQVTVEDRRQIVYGTLRCGPTPTIQPDDLLIDHLNRRFRVISVGGSTRFGVRVQQVCQIVEIQRGNIEDAIPLRVDTETLIPVAPRNYTNPHTPEGAFNYSPDLNLFDNLFPAPPSNGSGGSRYTDSDVYRALGEFGNGILKVTSGALGLTTWSAEALSVLTADFDILIRSGGAASRLAIGADGTFVGNQGGVLGYFSVGWSVITGKPSTFSPSAHTHDWSEVTGKPSTFTPSAHTHAWTDLTGVPSEFPPAAHTQSWSTLTDIPASFTPSAHTHSSTDITDFTAAVSTAGEGVFAPYAPDGVVALSTFAMNWASGHWFTKSQAGNSETYSITNDSFRGAAVLETTINGYGEPTITGSTKIAGTWDAAKTTAQFNIVKKSAGVYTHTVKCYG